MFTPPLSTFYYPNTLAVFGSNFYTRIAEGVKRWRIENLLAKTDKVLG